MGRSFTQNGFRSLAYAIAFSSGKPSLKKLIRKSQTGQFSTLSSRMTLSPKMMTLNSSSFPTKRLRMLREGLERALLSKAQIPMVPILLGFGGEMVRSPEGEAELPFDIETRRELVGVRPLIVRPPWLRDVGVGVGEVGDVTPELDATEVVEAAIGSPAELLAADGDKAPLRLDVVTERF